MSQLRSRYLTPFNLRHFYLPHFTLHRKQTMAQCLSIKLTPAEALLQKTLLDCQSQLRDPLEIRFAGGWVRDKLLGIQSHDIDVALSSMTGRQFGETLKSFLDRHGSEYKIEAENLGVKANLGSLHEIMAAPEKSKHLETIATKMFGLELDFVNLRKETYAEDSRNPQMEFGTPEEDALRRDATINALFYNLATQSIEDFTGRGIIDMQNRIMRTPLAPYQTFKDDPLRVLRLIRFASRLEFEIDQEALEAMKENGVHEALLKKISRERVGVEIGKMFKGPHPNRASVLIYENGLYPATFACLPSGKPCPDITRLPNVLNGLRRIEKERQRASEHLDYPIDVDDQAQSYLLAVYAPWFNREPDAVLAAREAIKGDKGEKKMIKILSDAIKNRMALQDIIKRTLSGAASRSDLGMSLYRFGPSWRFQVLYSLFVDFLAETFEVAMGRHASFLKTVEENGLAAAAEIKPLIDGNEIKRVLDMKAGRWMTKALDLVREWQFENPRGSKEEAITMIKNRKQELDLG